MGHIRKDFGKITLESRRESFYIHPSYGYRREYPQTALNTIPVGECFRYAVDDEPWQVVGQLMGATLVKSAVRTHPGEGDRVEGSSRVMVHPAPRPDHKALSEEVAAEGPFAEHWRDTPHPEFLNEDIDDLIAALEELRTSRES